MERPENTEEYKRLKKFFLEIGWGDQAVEQALEDLYRWIEARREYDESHKHD
jgi:hypothetical protein